MNRAEHIEWCKQRAREYLDAGDASNAVASMLSDLGKHDETAAAGRTMAMMGMMYAMNGDVQGARSFIEGF